MAYSSTGELKYSDMVDENPNKIFDNIRRADIEYDEKDINDIIFELAYTKEEEELLCKDIILHLETTAAEELQKDKCVQLPYIGSLRKSPIKKCLEENRVNFRIASKSLNKEDYTQHCSDVFRAKKAELRREDYVKAKRSELKKKHKAKYEQYYKLLGPAYANMYIESILMLDVVPYNQEFEDRLKELENE